MTKSKFFSFSFLEGFLIILIEIISSKLLSCYYGSTLYVWSTVLALTMFSLAIGYFLGAILSKKNDTKEFDNLIWLKISFVLIYFVFVSTFIHSIYSSLEPFFLSLFVSTFLLIFPVLILVSMLSPLLIAQGKNINFNLNKSTSYSFTASSLGAIIGSILVGFILIPFLGYKSSVLVLIGLTLLMYLFFSKLNKIHFLIYILSLLIGLNSLFSEKKNENSENGNQIIVHNSDGVLGNLKVVDYYNTEAKAIFRKLLINNIAQTHIMRNTYAQSAWNYPHILALLSTMKSNKAKTLLVGLGGGSVAKELQRQGFAFDAIEIDQRVANISKEYFYVDPTKYNLILEDARYFFRKNKGKYDLIILDVLQGEIQPEYMFTLESLKSIYNSTSKHGILLINYQGTDNLRSENKAFFQLYKTMLEAGFKVQYWKDSKLKSKSNDIIFILSKGNLSEKIDSKRLEQCCLLKEEVNLVIKTPIFKKIENKNLEKLQIYTDDLCDLEQNNNSMLIAWRKKMILK